MTTNYKTLNGFLRDLANGIPRSSQDGFLISLGMEYDEMYDNQTQHPVDALSYGIISVVKRRGITMDMLLTICKDLKCMNSANVIQDNMQNTRLQRLLNPGAYMNSGSPPSTSIVAQGNPPSSTGSASNVLTDTGRSPMEKVILDGLSEKALGCLTKILDSGNEKAIGETETGLGVTVEAALAEVHNLSKGLGDVIIKSWHEIKETNDARQNARRAAFRVKMNAVRKEAAARREALNKRIIAMIGSLEGLDRETRSCLIRLIDAPAATHKKVKKFLADQGIEYSSEFKSLVEAFLDAK